MFTKQIYIKRRLKFIEILQILTSQTSVDLELVEFVKHLILLDQKTQEQQNGRNEIVKKLLNKPIEKLVYRYTVTDYYKRNIVGTISRKRKQFEKIGEAYKFLTTQEVADMGLNNNTQITLTKVTS